MSDPKKHDPKTSPQHPAGPVHPQTPRPGTPPPKPGDPAPKPRPGPGPGMPGSEPVDH